MEVLSLLWQLGILASILIFGLKLGIASGLAHLSKKHLLAICIGYGGGVLILAKISSFYTNEISNLINTYNSLFFIIMAAIMIFSGIYTIKEWKSHEKNTMRSTGIILIAPCPCYFGSILASIIMAAPTVGLGTFLLSQYVAIALVIIILFGYFASKLIVKFVKTPYPIIFGNFMLFLGIYFLLSAILIPNIIEVFGQSMNSMKIPSITSLIISLIIAIIIVIISVFISKKNDFLIKY